MKFKSFSVFSLIFAEILFLALDIRLFHSIQSIHSNHSLISSKSVMLDHINSYVMSPLSRYIETNIHLSQTFPNLTANHVSYAGVVVAVVASRVVVNDALSVRRLAVVIFLFRQLLDDFDGLVARIRMGINSQREISVHGSQGYVVDGICDAIGFTVFLFGVLLFSLRRRDNKYKLLEEARPDDPYSARVLIRNHVLFGLQMLLSCVLWNRYIYAFHHILEVQVTPIKVEIFKSRLQWLIMWAWRCFGNAHQMMNFLLASLWLGKSEKFLHWIHWFGFVALIGLSFLTEVHINDIETYLKHISMNNK